MAITPASGFVDPVGALAIGIAAGLVCYWGAVWLKNKLGYDDSLDVFGVHGLGGIVGAVLTGVFAVSSVGGDAARGLIDGNPAQIWIQIEGIFATIIYCAVVSFILLKLIDIVIGLRVEKEFEIGGLDLSLHGESVH